MPKMQRLFWWNGRYPVTTTAAGTTNLLSVARFETGRRNLKPGDLTDTQWNEYAIRAKAAALSQTAGNSEEPRGDQPKPPPPPPPVEVTLEDFIKTFLKHSKDLGNVDDYRLMQERRLGKMADHLGRKRPLRSITADEMAGWQRALVDRELKNWTLTGYIVLARALFKLAVRRKLILSNPAEDLKYFGIEASHRRPVIVDENLMGKLDAAIAGRANNLKPWLSESNLCFRVALRLGYETGARPSELRALTWENLDWDGAGGDNFYGLPGLWIPNIKTRRSRSHRPTRFNPLGNKALALLRELKTVADPSTDRILFKLQNRSTMTKVGWIFELAGEPPIKEFWRTLRRSKSIAIRRKGLDVKTYARLLGHSELVALRDYQSVTRDDMLAARELLQ